MGESTDSRAAVLVDGLRVHLGASRVLDGISLRVAEGETLALLGANGSGKTTLVKALMGLVPVTAGRVELYGSDIGNRRSVPWSRIGYVPQRVNSNPAMAVTAEEVVASGLLTDRNLRPGRRGHGRVMVALDQVGLSGRARESVHIFSGGQQQRVLIARALVRQPDLLVIDEPMSGIDRKSQEALAATLGGLQREGTSIVVVLHDLGVLAPIIERAVVLENGCVVHDGAPPTSGPPSPDQDHFHGQVRGEPPRRTAPAIADGWRGQ
ncbi:metal ABC transporter ATP-binding protein [Arthrobacter zhaoguopingii]|uniref:metal ABC transporter ATP-binding protein n=1 Tax=Arthrobacter zhaoguopingii TaxID=2681491 RepID=UPI00135A797F|nr:metal ABC transporter ATP-binding protein [Arthrobacter zhaoguopingii]